MKQEPAKSSKTITEGCPKPKKKIVECAHQTLKKLFTEKRLNFLSLPELKELLAVVDRMLDSCHSGSQPTIWIFNFSLAANSTAPNTAAAPPISLFI